MRDVLVTENIVGSGMESLRLRYDVAFEPELWKRPDKLQDMIPAFTAIIVRNQTKVTSKLIASASYLKVIGWAGAGLDNIDLDAATSAGIVVVYTPEQNSISIAELTLGMMLALARNIIPANNSSVAGEWRRHDFTGGELYGKTLGWWALVESVFVLV